jgi:hypothetical protein
MSSDADVDAFSFGTFENLVQASLYYYHRNLEKAENDKVVQRRGQLINWIRKFHEDCGTLNSNVEESIENLRQSPCLFLMTAHQPNLFAYGGVLRKATLNQVLAEQLSKKLKLPVVSFFGLADQDFTDDRWVKSALLPDVERRDGILEIRAEMPDKLLLNKAAKPSRQVFDRWRHSICDWLDRNLNLANKSFNPSGHSGTHTKLEKNNLTQNLDGLWNVVEEAYSRAEVLADFNAYVISRIVNSAWGYGTLFSRFSECQQIFGPEFYKLLTRFEEYSRFLKEATTSSKDSQGGVYESEWQTLPFWYHCDCGSKARFMAEQQRTGLTGHGACLRCGKEYQIDFSHPENDISKIVAKISARSLSMPLVFFEGLGVSCYIGGSGGKQYLQQAEYVARRMGILFPPIAIWRPKDIYSGIGQLAALSILESLTGIRDFSKYETVKTQLENKVAAVEKEIEGLEQQKQKLVKEIETSKKKKINQMRALSAEQDQIRREHNYPVLSRNLKLVENIGTVMKLHPCIVDYAVNIGLKETSEQWISYLTRDGNLLSNVLLNTRFENSIPQNQVHIDWR